MIKNLIIKLGILSSYILTSKLVWTFSFVRSLFYTGWKKGSFKEMKGFINYPIGVSGGKNISIGEKTIIGKHSLITTWNSYGENDNHVHYTPNIVIGNNCHIGEYAYITAINEIIIGDNVLTGRNVLISDNSHGDVTCLDFPPKERPLTSKGPVHIGHNVWIGDHVVILSGVMIGEGAVIGANSVVTKDVKAKTVVAGTPAKVIK